MSTILSDTFSLPQDVTWWITSSIIFLICLSFAYTFVLEPLYHHLLQLRAKSTLDSKDPTVDRRRHQIILQKQKEYNESVRLKEIRDNEIALQKLKEAELLLEQSPLKTKNVLKKPSSKPVTPSFTSSSTNTSSSSTTGSDANVNSTSTSTLSTLTETTPNTSTNNSTPSPQVSNYSSSAAALIKEQDLEFQESLKRDQEKEIAKQKEIEQQKKREREMKELADSLPSQDFTPEQETCEIRIRFPNGVIAQRRFLATTSVQTLFNWAGSLGFFTPTYDIIYGIPKRKLSEDMKLNLKEAKLTPASMVYCEEI